MTRRPWAVGVRMRWWRASWTGTATRRPWSGKHPPDDEMDTPHRSLRYQGGGRFCATPSRHPRCPDAAGHVERDSSPHVSRETYDDDARRSSQLGLAVTVRREGRPRSRAVVRARSARRAERLRSFPLLVVSGTQVSRSTSRRGSDRAIGSLSRAGHHILHEGPTTTKAVGTVGSLGIRVGSSPRSDGGPTIRCALVTLRVRTRGRQVAAPCRQSAVWTPQAARAPRTLTHGSNHPNASRLETAASRCDVSRETPSAPIVMQASPLPTEATVQPYGWSAASGAWHLGQRECPGHRGFLVGEGSSGSGWTSHGGRDVGRPRPEAGAGVSALTLRRRCPMGETTRRLSAGALACRRGVGLD